MTDYRKKCIFVTGTDTGVGKTIVAAGLVRLARRSGSRALAVKPVETGCSVRDGMLYPEDGVFLRNAAQNDISLDECVPFRFSLAASPARAAAAARSNLHISDLEEHVRAVAEDADLTVVEGAGGLMVPIQGDVMMIDLLERLGSPAVIVAKTKLGTVNHTLLSLNALRQRQIETAGIVLSCSSDDPGPEEEFTPGDISRLAKDVAVLVLPYLSPETATNPDKIADIMSQNWPEQVLNRLIDPESPAK
jgi:dethiobiotin synthetase